MTTYKFSEETLKQSKRRILTIQIVLPFVLLIFILVSPILDEASLGIKIGSFIVTTVILESLLIVLSFFTHKKLRRLTLTVTENLIERTGGKYTEKIYYDDIKSVQVIKKPSNEIVYIKISSKTQRPVNIYGFESINLIAEQIANQVTDKAIIQKKKWIVDWNGPLMQITAAVTPMLVILFVQRAGRDAYDVFNIFLFFAIALFTLIYRPIARSSGKRFEKFELALGIILLVLVIFMLIMKVVIFWMATTI